MGRIWWTEPDSSHAFRLSVVSVVVTAAAGIGGCVAYGVTGSSLMLCYGLENLVDFLSSIVVCWRFFSPSGTTSAHDADLRKREKRASIAISFILALLGIGVIVASIEDFTHGSETLDNLKKIIITAIFSVFVFGTMSMVKFHYAKMLQSASLQKDAVCSLIGTVLSGSLFVNSLIIMKESDAWWLDPLIALGCGTAALIIGMQAIYYAYVVQGIPVLNIKWWMTSQGDGTDEFTGRELTPEERGEVPADKESEMVGASGNDEDRSRNEEGSGDGEKPESEIV
uniref:Cation efflux protein transmembrane domain-containing protein n=1 Tax=Odontella aurita TaxID=265563 RepID=A0A7S4I5Q1_9STRA|mmetsp:Transcript_20349/g.58850  ORF Transcript_20349/g.58850 Transcript_20349/m.58850 type:complete len:283 (+) Transcript_20349:124-972(+)